MTMTILNFSNLLTPISVNNQCGKDIRLDTTATVYYQIKDARTVARNIERQALQGVAHEKKANWSVVQEQAISILNQQSKDLEIAVWLTEALLREYSFAGLKEGFQLIKSLIENFRDDLFPLPDEDGIFTRLASLISLNGEENIGTLIVPIAITPLTQGNTVGPFALWQYQQAMELLKISDPDKRIQRIANGAITLDDFMKATAETSTTFIETTLQDLKSCISEYKAINCLLEEKYEYHAPPCSRIIAELNACIDCLESTTKNIFKNNNPSLELKADNNFTTSASNNFKNNSSLSNNHAEFNRHNALTALVDIANFFRRSEPHSPIPYMLERIVQWGEMSLPQLLKILIIDEQARGHVSNLTGINID